MNLVLKQDRHTWNGRNTHLVSESLFGAELTLAVQTASGMGCIWGGRHRGPWAGDTATAGPHGPRDGGEEGQTAGSLAGGAGAGSPQSPLLPAHGSRNAASARAQSPAGRPSSSSNNHTRPNGKGRRLNPTPRVYSKAPWKISVWHLCSSIVG